MKKLKTGQIIKTKVPLLNGWKGYGVLLEDEDEGLLIFRRLPNINPLFNGLCICRRVEAAACGRPPDHVKEWAANAKKGKADDHD